MACGTLYWHAAARALRVAVISVAVGGSGMSRKCRNHEIISEERLKVTSNQYIIRMAESPSESCCGIMWYVGEEAYWPIN